MLGEKICKTPEEFKAWSQNLGHDQVLTTFSAYGPVSVSRQSEIFQTIQAENSTQKPANAEPTKEEFASMLAYLHRKAS